MERYDPTTLPWEYLLGPAGVIERLSKISTASLGWRSKSHENPCHVGWYLRELCQRMREQQRQTRLTRAAAPFLKITDLELSCNNPNKVFTSWF